MNCRALAKIRVGRDDSFLLQIYTAEDQQYKPRHHNSAEEEAEAVGRMAYAPDPDDSDGDSIGDSVDVSTITEWTEGSPASVKPRYW